MEFSIDIKYFVDDFPELEQVEGSDWIDLRSSSDVIMNYLDFKLIPLGVAMRLPEGYEAYIVPRSSTFKNFGIIQSNHQGVVDNSYAGDDDMWSFPAICLKKEGTVIHKGDRICQFRIQKKQPRIIFNKVLTLDEKSRGGFGSTGIT